MGKAAKESNILLTPPLQPARQARPSQIPVPNNQPIQVSSPVYPIINPIVTTSLPISETSNIHQRLLQIPLYTPAYDRIYKHTMPTDGVILKAYPGRGSKEAPIFDGHKTSIQRYLEDINELCIQQGEDKDVAKIRKALWYVDYRFYDLWKQILSETKTWEENKLELLTHYPGLNSIYKYSVNDLMDFIEKYSMMSINNQENLAEYHCEFMVIASYLEKEKLMTKDDINRNYMMGLPENFHN
ncbi:hypothetical protein GALMADRAFT_139818 [Galerina marginata CBS 339.88]|uniref:Retrotransposon gag domain-containing protein n=1 Tax=Galerina marginata (strain CBS 339.88) TaxID=685588 RepID=A0A067T177_GALM3|nr:hypothetical protein GALMADRAFT_139818 [Galerina marginata CBS 339.88]